MLVVPRKTMEAKLGWVQVRRIRCDGCGDDFRYLARGTCSAKTSGLPVISSDEDLRRIVKQRLGKITSRIARKPRLGQAMCPNCRRYQAWMVRDSRLRAYGPGLIGGAMVGGVFFIMGAMMVPPSVGSPALAAVCMGAGLGLGALWGWKGAITRGPHTGPVDRRAMTESAYRGFQESCEANRHQPALAWHGRLGGRGRVFPLDDYGG